MHPPKKRILVPSPSSHLTPLAIKFLQGMIFLQKQELEGISSEVSIFQVLSKPYRYLFLAREAQPTSPLRSLQTFFDNNALLKAFKFLIPKSPHFLGLQTKSQATRGILALDSTLDHKNLLMICSIFSSNLTGILNRLIAYKGKFWSVEEMSCTFLAWLRITPFHLSIFLLNLSNRPSQKDSGVLEMHKGSPN